MGNGGGGCPSPSIQKRSPSPRAKNQGPLKIGPEKVRKMTLSSNSINVFIIILLKFKGFLEIERNGLKFERTFELLQNLNDEC